MISPEEPAIVFEDIGRAATNTKLLDQLNDGLFKLSSEKGLEFEPIDSPSILYVARKKIKIASGKEPVLNGLTNSRELIFRLEDRGILEKRFAATAITLDMIDLTVRPSAAQTHGAPKLDVITSLKDAPFKDSGIGKIVRYGTVVNKERLLTQNALGYNTGLTQFWGKAMHKLVIGNIKFPEGSEEISDTELIGVYRQVRPRMDLSPVSEINLSHPAETSDF